MSERVYLSPPHMSSTERDLLLEAFDSNWISAVGPDLGAFEAELAAYCGRAHAVALSSGTAALHLALGVVGVRPGDDVIVPSLTFVATANAVVYTGARPCFVDSEAASWNLDPDLLADELERRARMGNLPAAVIAVDLYGQCADHRRLAPLCDRYEIPYLVDAAEALGAGLDGRPAGSYGRLAAVSFNGNKIMTTGGGGALLSDDEALIATARKWATQSRDDAPHYQHSEVGYNYRLSNLLAALGRGQLDRLPAMMQRRHEINRRYRNALGAMPGVGFQPGYDGSAPNHWLTVITIDPAAFGADRERVRLALDDAAIESRPAWKPMHLQPLFADAPMTGGAVGEAVFADGLALPSGSSMADADLERTIEIILEQSGY